MRHKNSGYKKMPGLSNKKKQSKPSLSTVIKKVINNQETPLHKTSFNGYNTLTAGNYNTYNILGNIATGTGDTNRLNDTIHLEALKMNLRFTNTYSTGHDVFVRFMVFWSTNTYKGGSDTGTTAGLTASSIFLAGSYGSPSNGGVSGMIDSKQNTCILDRKFIVKDSPSSATGAVGEVCKSINLRLKKKYIYDTGTNYGKFKNLYVVVACDGYGQTLGVTTPLAFTMSTDLIFKNDS